MRMICVLLGLLVLAPAAAFACPCSTGYGAAQISIANSTVPLMSYTGYQGGLAAIKCAFPSGGSVRVEITLDTGTYNASSTSFVIDSTFFERESSGAGQYVSGWIPLGLYWIQSAAVQLNNSGLGTETINCFLSWQVDKLNIE